MQSFLLHSFNLSDDLSYNTLLTSHTLSLRAPWQACSPNTSARSFSWSRFTHLPRTISSIFKSIRVVSVARVMALIVTRAGCITFRANISEISPPLLISNP
eukprot:XP_001707262.1 Hypothetical protein GL50803_32383 [Giardia lamblia ATCC 50803]